MTHILIGDCELDVAVFVLRTFAKVFQSSKARVSE